MLMYAGLGTRKATVAKAIFLTVSMAGCASSEGGDLHIYANGQEGTVTVSKSSSARITWSAASFPAGGCAVYGPASSPLDNTNLFNGSGSTVVSDPGQGTPPLTQTAVYTLTCSRADGTKVNASVTVNPT
jgi:hypothetical protein